MDEEKQGGPRKRRRVLRARDVIPPFDISVPESPPHDFAFGGPVPPLGDGTELEPSPTGARSQRRGTSGTGQRPEGRQARDELSPVSQDDQVDMGGGTGLHAANGAEIPTYDLAENILAAQRRAAGRRRRAPGQVEEEPGAGPGEAGVRMFIPEAPPQDLLELQRLVAGIVARDIARLCQRPTGWPDGKKGRME